MALGLSLVWLVDTGPTQTPRPWTPAAHDTPHPKGGGGEGAEGRTRPSPTRTASECDPGSTDRVVPRGPRRACGRAAVGGPDIGMHGVGIDRFNDPSAGSPTETLLRLLLPLGGRV